MAAYQYIYVMKGLNKTYPGRQTGPEGHLAVVPAGREDRRAGPERRRQIDPAQDHGGPGRQLHRRGLGGRGRQGRHAGAGAQARRRQGRAGQRHGRRRRDGPPAGALRGGVERLLRPRRRHGQADRRAGRAAGEDRRRQRLGPAAHGRDRHGRAALPAARRQGREPVGRRAPPRGALPAAAQQARHAAARRADQPSRRRVGGLAGAPSRANSPAPSWPSPTTATSSTTWPAGSSSSTAAPASRGKATTPPG